MRTDALQRDGSHHIIFLGWGKLSIASFRMLLLLLSKNMVEVKLTS